MIDNKEHKNLEKSVAEIDFGALRDEIGAYHPSPEAWEDQVLYFLMLDRFSDDNEKDHLDNNGVISTTGSTPKWTSTTPKADKQAWFDAGSKWCGGNIRGLMDKLGYLKRMGITTVWVSPVFKQVAKTYDWYNDTCVNANCYHGYGIQNFLDVDPNFGTRQDLRDFVREAHRLGIYVVLDIIFNHAGDVFQYHRDRFSFYPDGKPVIDGSGRPYFDPRWDNGNYTPIGFRDGSGKADSAPPQWPDGGVWPVELQTMNAFNRKGRINNWNYEREYLEGDFCTLKNIDHGYHDLDQNGHKILDLFHPTPYLTALCEVYKFWIAFADIDGFRIDTVKHMEKGATRLFASKIREFARTLGKNNFFLLGEIAGGRDFAFHSLQETGLDAALAIDDVSDKIEYLPKGWRDPEEYFNLFCNPDTYNANDHRWFGKRAVTMFDDHDKIGRIKRRFCGDTVNNGRELLIPALALNLTTLGIPCIYYGSEQYFDGSDQDQDRALRECMFGGVFGSMQTTNVHFFDENSTAYKVIGRICQFRAQNAPLREGEQYLRPISGTGNESEFGYPRKLDNNTRMLSVVAWSRILNGKEILLAINTDPHNPRTAWVTIDYGINSNRSQLTCLFSTDPAQQQTTAQIADKNGKSVRITVPPAGFVAWG